MTDSKSGDLSAVDEMLQIMYWLRGENLASAVDADSLGRFVMLEPQQIGRLLERLVVQGLARRVESGHERIRYALTDGGVHEGGRRFADEFSDMTRPGHGECGDPDCECHRTGSPEDCQHRSPL